MMAEYHLRVSYDPPPFPGWGTMIWQVTDDNGEGEVLAHGPSPTQALATAIDDLDIKPRAITHAQDGLYIVEGEKDE